MTSSTIPAITAAIPITIKLNGLAFMIIFRTRNAAPSAPTIGISVSILSATHSIAPTSTSSRKSPTGSSASKIFPKAFVNFGKIRANSGVILSINFVIDGIKPVIRLVPAADIVRFSVSIASVNATPESTASSLSTRPRSFASCFKPSVDSAVPLSNGISSMAFFPNRSIASAVFSAPAGMP